MNEKKERILDVALEVLGRDPDAGMEEIASAAGVVRRTVYGHFPSRGDLVRTLTQRAVSEITAVLGDVNVGNRAPDEVWVAFIDRLWPLVHRYRVLLALRRGEFGEDIHALLTPLDAGLADLVGRGQDSKAFGRHLPADVLSQVAQSTVFAIADHALAGGSVSAREATIASLLLLGVPQQRAEALAARPRPSAEAGGTRDE